MMARFSIDDDGEDNDECINREQHYSYYPDEENHEENFTRLKSFLYWTGIRSRRRQSLTTQAAAAVAVVGDNNDAIVSYHNQYTENNLNQQAYEGGIHPFYNNNGLVVPSCSRRSRKHSSSWLFLLFKAFMVVLVAWYTKRSSTNRITIERYSYHTWYAFSEAYYLAAEGIVHISTFFADQFLADKSCRLHVPVQMPEPRHIQKDGAITSMPPTEAWLNNKTVGQRRAISAIATALDGWALDFYHNEHHNSIINGGAQAKIENDNKSRKQPMSMVFAGPSGTGKSLTAFLLSQWLFQNCSATSSSVNSGVLVLHGEDFVDDENRGDATTLFDSMLTTQDEFLEDHKRNKELLNEVHYGVSAPKSRDKLQRTIVDFLVKRRRIKGSLIIIHGIEKMHSNVLSALSALFDAGSSCLSYYDERRRKRITAPSCEGVLFIFTTDLGTERIFRSVRDFGGRDSVSRIAVDTALRDSLNRHWNKSLNADKFFHVVVPFLPLGHIELEEIVRRQCEKLSDEHANRFWKRLEITQTARQRLVGTDFLEYIDLSKKGATTPLLIFSRYGASSLDSGPMQVLRSKVRRHLGAYPRPDQIAVFDYDIDKNQAIIQWCPETSQASFRHKMVCETSWQGTIEA